MLFNTAFSLGSLSLPHRLIQGPLAGYSCAPFRQLFSLFTPPAYAVSEMISAYDVVYKHQAKGRYLYRHPEEFTLCYQIAGHQPDLMAEAAIKLQDLGADLIDLNCGCPKAKIRKKGAGSALLDRPEQLIALVKAVRKVIGCPLTVKVRLQGTPQDLELAKQLADCGVDALIVHGRRWQDDYDIPCDLEQVARIKQVLTIPLIVNGDIGDRKSLERAWAETGADAFMISRAGTGNPALFQELLTGLSVPLSYAEKVALLMRHLSGLAVIEGEYQAVLQSKSLVRYYFGKELSPEYLQQFYQLSNLTAIEESLVQSA